MASEGTPGITVRAFSRRLPFVVVGVIAVATRLVADVSPRLSVLTIGGLALGAAAIGLRLNGREQPREWRRAWLFLEGGLLAFVGAAVIGAASHASHAGSFPTGGEPLALVGEALAVTGLLALLRHRLPGRAVDVALQGVTVAVAVGFVGWAAVGQPRAGSEPGVTMLAVAFPLLDIVLLWVAVRLISLTEDHPIAYRYLIGGLVGLCTVHAITAGIVLQGSSTPPGHLNDLALWAYCLWGVAALHPSLRARFDPVPSRPPRPARRQLVPVIATLLLGPVVIWLQTARGEPVPLLITLVASALVPLLIAAQLLHQVRERATAEHRAEHDPLTGLPNRVLFHDRVDVAVAHAKRNGTGFAVMFLDLDRFKSINDSLGHAVGDQLLQAVAKKLRRTLREDDTVARMGGDEFTLLIPETANHRDYERVAEKVLRAFGEPFLVGVRQLSATTSIGIATYPADGADSRTLLKNADTAMYRAKTKGRNTCQLYNSDMSARVQVKLALETSLRGAIERQELELHYQPKVDLRNGRIIGLEALARWRHPKLGSISPSSFIPLAEETGLIMPLGEWVLEAACRQNRRWIDSGLAPLPIAVNLSARQFEHQPLEELVARVLREADLPPELLELELTESVFLHDVRATRVILENLQAMGVRCSLDDFGTGFSGLNYLAEMPIDSLKIDQSFVQKIGTGQDDAIVGAVIALAHSLGMKVVAEGVETGEQARFLRSHGCEQMQGYLFSGPLPPDELEDMIRARVGVGVGVGAYPLPGAAAALHSQAGTQPRPDRPGLAGVESLLSMLCRDGANHHFDPDLVAAVLTALESDERLPPIAQRLSRSASVRLAAGTFAGLMPLGGGLAAAGALPAPAQLLAAGAFARIGIAVPTPDRWVISDGRSLAQPKRAPARPMPVPDPGPEPSRTPNPPTSSNPGSGGSDPGTRMEEPGNPAPRTPVVDHGQPNPGSPVETPGNPTPGTPVETPGNPNPGKPVETPGNHNPGKPVEKPGNHNPGKPVETPGNPNPHGPSSSTTTGKHGL